MTVDSVVWGLLSIASFAGCILHVLWPPRLSAWERDRKALFFMGSDNPRIINFYRWRMAFAMLVVGVATAHVAVYGF
jgi:hypothetical protein